MNCRVTAVVLLCCLLASGTIAAQGRPVLVTDSSTPLEFRGFRAKPPPGTSWYLVFRSNVDIIYIKRMESKLHTFYVRMSIALLPDGESGPDVSLEFIKKNFQVIDQPGSRFMPQKFDIERDLSTGNTCSRYVMQADDTGAPQADGRTLILESNGLVCIHPNMPRHVVHIFYSERGGPAESSAQLKTEGESFMRGMVFTQSQ